ncbi:MAG: hypothetical protein J6L79_03140 [Muribaculaceae bacterium]|nr:hypothetical protein [Muribaculaceae bacterium]
MIKNKKNHQIPNTEKWSVWLTPEMLNHLTEPTKFKASKLDAYLNLLEDAAVAKATYESAYGQIGSPEAAPLVISITNLAKRWHWSRDTVRKFLNQLEALGMLSKTRIDRRTLVSMTVDCGDAGHSSAYGTTPVPFKMPQQLVVTIDEWLSGIIDESELVDAIEETVASFDRTNEDTYADRVIALQYSLIRQLISRWYVNPPVLPEIADSYSVSCLEHIFSVCLSGNWVEWLKFLANYIPGLNQGYYLADYTTTSVSVKDARYSLYGLFIHLKVDFIISCL